MGTVYEFKLKSHLVDALFMAQQMPLVVVNPDDYEVGPYNWVVTTHRSVAITLAELFVAEDWPFEFSTNN